MGFLYKNVCYPSQEQARQQSCSDTFVTNSSGQNVYTAECNSTTFTGTNFNLCKRTNGGACTNQATPWPVTPDCTYAGGITLATDFFLAGVGLLIVVWGAKKLLQVFDHSPIEN